MDEQTEKPWYMCECMCIYVCVCVCVIKKKKCLSFVKPWAKYLKWGKSDRETKDQPTKLAEKEIELMVTRSGGEKEEELEKDGQEAEIWNYK